MIRFMLAVFLFGALSTSLAADHEVFRADGSGQLLIGPEGNVLEVKFDQGFGSKIDPLLRKRVQTWRFKPIIEAGQPVKALAHFRLSLQADFGGKSRGDLLITRADFVDPPKVEASQRKMVAPRYPTEAIRAGVGAEFVLLVQFDEHGNVTETSGQNGWINVYGRLPSQKRQDQFIAQFLANADEALRKWSFADLAAKGERFAKVPLGFWVSKSKRSPWRRSYPITVAKEPWTVEMDAASVSVVGADGNVSDRDIRLLDALDSEALPEG